MIPLHEERCCAPGGDPGRLDASAAQALLAQLDQTPAHNHSQRPPATGGAGIVLTDC